MTIFGSALVIAILASMIGSFPGWFDSGEFATAISTLSVPHPTGHPTYLLFAEPFTFLPLGSMAFRTSLVSSVSALIAMLAISYTAHLLTNASKRFLFFASGLVILLPSISLQITRTEVYATQFAFSWIVLLLLLKGNEKNDERWNLAAAFFAGITFALQPLLTVTLLPLFLLISLRSWPRLFLFFFVGTMVNLYIPLRALTDPTIDWDAPSTFHAWLKFMEARDFRIFFHPPLSSAGIRDWKAGALLKLVHPSLFLPLSIGFVSFLRHWRERSKQMVLIAFLLSWIPWLTKDFHLRNPDSHAYVMWPISLVFLLSFLALWHLESRYRYVGRISALLLAIFLLPTWKIGFGGLSAHASQPSEALSRHLDLAPVKSAIIVDSDHWLFPLWYRSYVEGRRPDVAILGNGLGRSSWYIAQVTKRYEDLFHRPGILEGERREAARPFGYLFGEKDVESLRNDFAEACQMANDENDPFSIGRSVCAQVVITFAGALANNRAGTGCSIHFLEKWLREPYSNVSCWPMKSFSVPSPLIPDEPFLTDPRAPVSLLAKKYLSCNRQDLARDLLKRREGDQNSSLLQQALVNP